MISNGHGVNLIAAGLRKAGGIPRDQLSKFVDLCKASSFNFVRVVVYWDAYEANPSLFLSTFRELTGLLDQAGINFFVDNHHFNTAPSYGGNGFPSRFTQGKTISQFWSAFWRNQIPGLWTQLSDFLRVLIQNSQNLSNCIGYEPLNEPQVYSDSDYQFVGVFNTFMLSQVQGFTSKAYIFCRENGGGTYQRRPSLEPQMIPAGPGTIIYDAHIYNLTSIETHVQHINEMGISDVIIGETAMQDNQGISPTLDNAKAFLSVFKREGWSSCYWAFGLFGAGPGNVLALSNGTLNTEGEIWKAGISAIYGSEIPNPVPTPTPIPNPSPTPDPQPQPDPTPGPEPTPAPGPSPNPIPGPWEIPSISSAFLLRLAFFFGMVTAAISQPDFTKRRRRFKLRGI